MRTQSVRSSRAVKGKPGVSTGVKPGWARPVRMSSRVVPAGVSMTARSSAGCGAWARTPEANRTAAASKAAAVKLVRAHACRKRRLPYTWLQPPARRF